MEAAPSGSQIQVIQHEADQRSGITLTRRVERIVLLLLVDYTAAAIASPTV